MTPQTGKQILTIHILPNISISKGNQTIKFGQLIGLKVRNIFLKKLPLSEKNKWFVPNFIIFR